jgi:hypothetical protein
MKHEKLIMRCHELDERPNQHLELHRSSVAIRVERLVSPFLLKGHIDARTVDGDHTVGAALRRREAPEVCPRPIAPAHHHTLPRQNE